MPHKVFDKIAEELTETIAGVRGDASWITPAMIEAGVRVYLEHCPDSGVGDRLDRKMVVEIFSEMLAAMRC